MSLNNQKVTVVITTIGDLTQLKRSLKSVKNQTFKNIEIIVVLDKKNDIMLNFLTNQKKINKNFDFIVNEKSMGGSEARNIGVRKATGNWVALLDDDDEWTNNKIYDQINDILSNVDLCDFNNVVSSTRLCIINEKTGKEKFFPKKCYDDKSDLANFLFGIKYGKNIGAIQTSSILASKKLFLEVPFTKDLPKHQDWDWLMKVKYVNKGNIRQLKGVYTNYYINDDGISQKNRWKTSLIWINKYKEHIAINAYESFMLSTIVKGVIVDTSLSTEQKKKIIKSIYKDISYSKKLSLYNLRVILYMYKNK